MSVVDAAGTISAESDDMAVVAFLAASFRSVKWLNKCQKKYHPPICYITESTNYKHLAFCPVPLIYDND